MRALEQTEIALVLDVNGRYTAIAVDSIESVEMLEPGSIEPMPNMDGDLSDSITSGYIGKRKDDMVLILDSEKICLENHHLCENEQAA